MAATTSDTVEKSLPGALPFSPELQARLREARLALGAAYQPRTHHREGNTPFFTNRLILEPSPYLRQHAHNPVNWQPWGDEAFAAAQAADLPVFLSIGYATCHWCHVMEAESFEDEEIAAFMNQHFVCIKVDREERPDVDAVYMSAVQRLTGSGGWPMSVWLTPEREPFYGGTYFPPRDGVRGSRHGFLTVLRELDRTYRGDGARVKKAAVALTTAVRADLEGRPAAPGDVPGLDVVETAVAFYARNFDQENGGLARAPKFPSNIPVRVLLRHAARTGDESALAMVGLTLEKMAGGGMYDQIGGGFHRYSTDAQWLVPHFEKMLYDNALLVLAYTEAFQATGHQAFARVARETLDYVLREMTAPGGGFYSATDADSEGEEGKFFVWSRAQVDDLLGEQADAFCRHYDITAAGNFEGHNIPNTPVPDEDAWSRFQEARARLYEARALRVPPLRDEKILTAWNGLMISALAVAGRVLGDAGERYLQAARRAADFVLTAMVKQGRLQRSHRDGHTHVDGFLEDHAFLVAGLLDLFEATAEVRWLEQALALHQQTDELFADRENGGWFMTGRGHERLLAREKPTYDGAEPSGTSVALLNTLRLATFTDRADLLETARRALASLAPQLSERPMAMSEALLGLEHWHGHPREVLLVWPDGAEAAALPLREALRTTFVPNRVLVAANQSAVQALATHLPFLRGRLPIDGRPTAYVCEQGQCQLPVQQADALRDLLRDGSRMPPMPQT